MPGNSHPISETELGSLGGLKLAGKAARERGDLPIELCREDVRFRASPEAPNPQALCPDVLQGRRGAPQQSYRLTRHLFLALSLIIKTLLKYVNMIG